MGAYLCGYVQLLLDSAVGGKSCVLQQSIPDAGSPTVYSHFNSGASCPAYVYGLNTCPLTGADCSESKNWEVKDLVCEHAFLALET
jgi:hypothetical protein